MSDASVKIGIINVSDRASAGIYADTPGQEALAFLQEVLATPFQTAYAVIPDERDQIADTLIHFVDDELCCLLLTTGGTGPSLRDVTPEATESVCEKIIPGFGEQMRTTSLKYVPTAILSRQTAGIRGRCLIVNLPGKPKAIRECLEAVFPAIPYCIDLMEGPRLETRPDSPIKAFRPKGA
ncbi:MAG: molybdopterin adenylyltransferase [Opitutales bacterium]